jgi:hypothetical protein
MILSDLAGQAQVPAARQLHSPAGKDELLTA